MEKLGTERERGFSKVTQQASGGARVRSLGCLPPRGEAGDGCEVLSSENPSPLLLREQTSSEGTRKQGLLFHSVPCLPPRTEPWTESEGTATLPAS